MSTTRWLIVAFIIVTFIAYLIWEDRREKKSVLSSDTPAGNPVASGFIPELNVAVNEPVLQATTLDSVKQVGYLAAKRTEKYATLFETIGKVLQYLNLFFGVVAIVLLLIVDIPTNYIPVGIITIILVTGVGYIQTSFIRGLASYFQMRSSEFQIRNWEN